MTRALIATTLAALLALIPAPTRAQADDGRTATVTCTYDHLSIRYTRVTSIYDDDGLQMSELAFFERECARVARKELAGLRGEYVDDLSEPVSVPASAIENLTVTAERHGGR